MNHQKVLPKFQEEIALAHQCHHHHRPCHEPEPLVGLVVGQPRLAQEHSLLRGPK